jgi:hypothetical protein
MRTKLLPRTAPGARATCEAFRFTEILDRLRGIAASGTKVADANFGLLKRDPRHPSLQFKKVGRYWSVRVGLRYRALAVDVDGGCLWFWIGSHADYDKLIG